MENEDELYGGEGKWKVVKQIMIDNMAVEILELETLKNEIKRFISITKFEKTKSIVVSIDKAERIAKALKDIMEGEDSE